MTKHYQILPCSQGSHPTGQDREESLSPLTDFCTVTAGDLTGPEFSLSCQVPGQCLSCKITYLPDRFGRKKKKVCRGNLAEKKISYLQTWYHLLCFLHFLFQMVLLFQKLLLPWILQMWHRVPCLPVRLEVRFCLFWKRNKLNVVMTDSDPKETCTTQ